MNALICFGRPEPAARHVEWVRRFILFHGKRHPRDLGINDVGQFLQHLAQSEKDPLSGIEQARETLEFLYACGLAGGVVVSVSTCAMQTILAVSPGAETPSAPESALSSAQEFCHEYLFQR